MTDCEAIEVKHSSAGRRSASSTRRAVTLMEVLTVITVMGILSVISVPKVRNTIEQSHADLAGANLKSIWTAQRYYWLENREYAPDLTTLQNDGLLDGTVVAGTSRYAVEGGPLRDPKGDRVFFDALKAGMPDNIEVIERDLHAEDPVFVKECVDRLISLIDDRIGD